MGFRKPSVPATEGMIVARPAAKPAPYDDVIHDRKETLYQYIIFGCSVISVISLLTLCSIVPSLYNYVNSISDFGRRDFSYCEVGYRFVNSSIVNL